MTPEELARKADTAGLRLVRFLWCGNDGTIRAKASSRHGLEGRLERGIGVTRAMQAMNGARPAPARRRATGRSASSGSCPTSTRSGRCRTRRTTGVVLTDHVAARRDARAASASATFLKRQQARLRERGLELRAAFENEFSLARREDGDYTPGRHRPVLLDHRDGDVAGVRRRAGGGAGGAADPARAVLRRARPRPAGGLDGARVRACRPRTSRCSCARPSAGWRPQQELVASLAPKPWPEVAGNGAHVHFSLWEGERTASTPRAGCRSSRSSSSRACSSICPACAGSPRRASTPTSGSRPACWAGAYACWGHDNREAPVRVPSPFLRGRAGVDQRRAQGGGRDLQPVPGARRLIAAGLDGVERGLELPEPVNVDPATLRASGERPAAAPGDAGRGARRARRPTTC